MIDPAALPVASLTLKDIARQWDGVAVARERQLISHSDVSYEHILVPEVLKMLGGVSGAVLDAGCGVGVFCEILADTFEKVVGVDVSEESIQLAKARVTSRNIDFFVSSVEEYVRENRGLHFEAAVANMSLQTVPNLSAFLSSIATALCVGGVFAITVPHPCFWPRYWQYEHEPWFSYEKEIPVEHPFSISGDRRILGRTVHYHRPLHVYFSELVQCGFVVRGVSEPLPSESVRVMYGEAWKYPRFLTINAQKNP